MSTTEHFEQRRQLTDIQSQISKLTARLSRGNGPSPRDVLARSVMCRVLAVQHKTTPFAVAAELFPYDRSVTAAIHAPGSVISKAAVAPAQTTVVGWASELVTPTVLGVLPIIAPRSAYSQLSQLPATIRADLAGHGSVKVPTRSPSPTLAPAFVGEGQPIPIRQAAVANTALTRKKAAVISEFTGEMLNRSAVDIEQLIRDVMAADTTTALDGILLDANPATAIRPAGILNGVTASAPTASGGLAALAGDVRTLAAAIEATGPLIAPTLIMSSTSALIVLLSLTGGIVLSVQDDGPQLAIVAAPSVPSKRLIMIDAANFASGEGDTPDIMTTTEALLHEEDTTPLPIGTAGSPATVAAPARSLFQTNAIAVRMITDCGWTMTRTGRVAYIDNVTW
ncbi:phage major capsid protein [Bradyrhizobium sp. LA6.12]|uniref:phage major capsid protein n=1 Tax=unclassified Bradyrhizobium TaxID=2631580 RepID=UPI0033930476